MVIENQYIFKNLGFQNMMLYGEFINYALLTETVVIFTLYVFKFTVRLYYY